MSIYYVNRPIAIGDSAKLCCEFVCALVLHHNACTKISFIQPSVTHLTPSHGLQGHVSQHLVCLTRLAEDKNLKTFVNKWRSEHEDWRVLANFLLSKNTSRHFKRSEQKQKVTKNSLLVEKELLRQRLDGTVSSLCDYIFATLISDTLKGPLVSSTSILPTHLTNLTKSLRKDNSLLILFIL